MCQDGQADVELVSLAKADFPMEPRVSFQGDSVKRLPGEWTFQDGDQPTCGTAMFS